MPERMDFADGNWWEFHGTVTRGMRKLFRKAGLKAVEGGFKENGATFDDPEKLKAIILAHPESLDLDAIDDAYLLHGTLAWSFSAPVTLAAIDALSDKYVEPVLTRMQELYAEASVEARKN